MSTYNARKKEALRRGISSAKLLSTSALTAAGILALSIGPAMADPAWVLDQVAGSFDTDASETVTNITQNSTRAIGEGNLDIANYQTVNIIQNNSSDLFVARDNRADPTRILGALNANGRVMVIDQNGIFFGADSVVNVGAIIASTSDISNAAIMGGSDSFEFSDFGNGGITLEGTINVAEAGLAAFVSPVAVNNGVINAKAGTVAFAAGQTVTLDLYGDGLVEIAVDGELADSLLSNTGEINAEGGVVQMTAVAAKDAVDNIINVEGVVTVASATQQGGKIILSGGKKGVVNVSGTLDASGTDGGEIEIDAQNTLLTADSNVRADGLDQGGSITLWGRENALYAGQISALGQNGFVETSGGNLGVWGDVNLSEGGEWLLDPTDIQIVGGSGNAALLGDLTSDIFFSPDDDGPDAVTATPDSWVWIGDANINTALNNGVNVTFETNSEGTRDGDIVVRSDAAISKTSGADSLLTFRAHDDIIIDGTITSTGPNKLSLNLVSDFDGSGGASGITINNTINLNGGNFDATAPDAFTVTGSGSVNANGGNVNIDQGGVFSSVNAGSITTHTTGTISVNQNVGGSITNAIQAIENGGTGLNTVTVADGTYAEDVIVDESNLVLKGEQAGVHAYQRTAADESIIEGFVKLEGGLDNVTIDGFTIENQGDEVPAFDPPGSHVSLAINTGNSNINILNNRFDGNDGLGASGIVTSIGGVSNVLIDQNNFENFSVRQGIYVNPNANGVDVRRNNFENNLFGAVIADGSGTVTVRGNRFTNNIVGLDIRSGALATATNNRFRGNDQHILYRNGLGPNMSLSGSNPNLFWYDGSFKSVDALTTEQLFDLEDHLAHQMDNAAYGLIEITPDNVYATKANLGIQQGVDSASAGFTVNIDAATFDEAVTIDKAITVLGSGKSATTIAPTSGNAFTVDGAVNGDISISDLSIDGATNGILVKRTTVGLGNLDLANLSISNSGNVGFGIFGNTANKVTITDSEFKDNGTLATTNRGQGDVLFYLYDGDITLQNIDVQGNTGDVDYGGGTGVAPTADYGIQIIGSNPNESWTPAYGPSGTIILDNVNVAGNYRAALLGIQEFDGIGPLTFTDVTLGGQTTDGTDSSGWASLFLSNLGAGDINLGNTVFDAIDGNYITLGAGLTYTTGNNIDATGATFEGVTGATATIAENFAIEDKIFHKIDFAPQGLVTWKAGELFVTGNSVSLFNPFAIQNAINAATAGDIVNVDDSTYKEHITIDKALKLTGHGTTIEAINATPLVTVTASNVNIDPITFDGANITDFGIDARGAGALGLTVDGNTFKNFNRAGIYIEANSGNAGLTRIINNTFEGSSTRGVQTGNLRGPGYKLLISGNTIGAAGDEVKTGLDIGRVINSSVSLAGGTINATGDAIYFRDGTFNTSSVVLYNVVATGGDEALDIQGIVRSGGTFVVNGGTFNGRGNGVEFQKVDGDLTLTNVTANSTTRDGVNMLGTIKGNVTINGGTFTGARNGIGSANNGNNIDGGTVTISDATIVGTSGNGVALGGVENGGAVYIVANNISAGEDGVRIDGDVTGSSRLEVTGNLIGYGAAGPVGGDGIEIDGAVTDSTVILGHYFDAPRGVKAQGIRADGSGIVFGDDVTNSNVEIATYINNAGIDGLRFEGDIDGSTVKTGVANFTRLTGGTGALGGFQAIAGQDGVEFEGEITGASTVTIDSNFGIRGNNGDGIRFEKAINGGSNVNITGNTNDFGGYGIVASNTGILVVEDVTGAGTTLNINRNTISASNNGIDIDNVSNGATVNVGGTGLFDGNRISATNGNGIEFDAGIDSKVTIAKNRISAGQDGINVRDGDRNHVTGVDNGAVVNILNNRIGSEGSDTIGDDGIDFDDSITGGSTVTISGNRIGRSNAYVGDDGIDIDSITGGATVNITNNPDIRARDNGIEISGDVNGGADVNITGNNHGIHAGDHGIYFGGDISGNADIDILRNIISANENRDDVGSGIWFGGSVTESSVTIGDGGYTQGSSSNIIRVAGNTSNGNGVGNLDGIHFDKEVGQGVEIVIDANRIGYGTNGNVGSNMYRAAVADDGIEFKGPVTGNADIDITDNWIRANDEGIQFTGEIRDRANILVGGLVGRNNDQNFIRGGDNGISFLSDVKGQALIEISYNDIEGDDDGILFAGNTSNGKSTGGISTEEIHIHNNKIVGGDNGINFEGRAFGNRHDIKVENNDIEGESRNGIVHSGGINNAHLKILNNDKIKGYLDGVQVKGFLYNNARVDIKGNDDVRGVRGDGIEVTDTGYPWGADVNIVDNHVHYTGDNGIEVANVDYVTIDDNTIHHTDEDGINVDNSYYAVIKNNKIDETDGHGIYVDDSRGAEITYNKINKNRRGANTLGNGIYVEDSNYVDVNFNEVDDIKQNGIYVSNSDFADIIGNDITDVDQHGIKVNPSDFVDIAFNTIHDAGWDGIRVDGGYYADIFGNHVHRVGDDGIDVNGNYGVDIYLNNIIQTGLAYWADDGNGIEVSESFDADIRFNRVERAGDDGIDLEDSAYADIRNNKVFASGDDGIDVENAYKVDINDNLVLGARDDGIEVLNSFDADVRGNTISLVGGDGIYAYRIAYGDVRGNNIYFTGDDGIDVRRSRSVDVNGNNIYFTGGDGIQVRGSRGADIRRNDIQFAFDDGIDVERSSYANIVNNRVRDVAVNGIEVSGGSQVDILRNRIRRTGKDGINVRRTDYSTINGNNIRRAGDDGIDVRNGYGTVIARNNIRRVTDDGIRVTNVHGYSPKGWDVTIRNNTVDRAGDDGIEVKNSGNTRIVGVNTVTDAGDDGIRVVNPRGYEFYDDFKDDEFSTQSRGGYYGYAPARVRITDNVVDNAGDDGIEVSAYDVNLRVGRNLVTDSLDNGILLNAKGGFAFPEKVQQDTAVAFLVSEGPRGGGFNSNIFDNVVTNSGSNGLHVKNAGHGDVILEGNTFGNNPVGARFESGRIDLTGRTNNFIVSTDYELPEGYEFVTGMQFDPAIVKYPYQTVSRLSDSLLEFSGFPAPLTIVDETLGTTNFEGFSNRAVGDAFYVRFEDGAILDELGNPIEIDGTFASWDGLVPNSFGNLLAPSVLQAIEDRLFDADDPALNGRGQIFVGDPLVGLENIEDFFNNFDGFSGGPNGLNVTLLGLPSVGFGGATNFANIAPAAGGDENPNDPEQLANIEPAAGGDEAACWGDAVGAAAGGAPVNFDFGGTFEESLADASACQSF